jgi:WD40 repeat-containing protein SMU1
MSPSASQKSALPIPAADILRLILSHLLEAGLTKAASALSEESGVGLAGSLHHPNNWIFHCASGNYSLILEQLALIDRTRARISLDLLASVHELAILEVAEGDLSVAVSMLRVMYTDLQESTVTSESDHEPGKKISRARLLDQKLADLANRRAKDPSATVPKDWYYAGSKQDMRDKVGKTLAKAIPHQPTRRLTALLQQAVQWQAYTGELPLIKQWWKEDLEPIYQDQPKKKKRKKQFDIVLGQVAVDAEFVDEATAETELAEKHEALPKDPFSIIKLGKKVTCNSAVFLPDASGLVTGSSDGFIEIWDEAHQYTQLKLDLPYQQAEELMGQDAAVTSLAVSNDGAILASGSSEGRVLIWRIDTGKCLRTVEAHQASISCLAFSPDASHVLTSSRDGLVREFGLRTARMLKEFSGHGSFVSHVSYQLIGQQRFIVTASGDGTVRLYGNASLDAIRILRPALLGDSTVNVGTSIIADPHRLDADAAGSTTIHSVLHMHTPASTMIIVPRGDRAFMVSYLGDVVRTFGDASVGGKMFVAAAVSPSNRLLYCVTEDGVCCIFAVKSGEIIDSIRGFGEQTARSANAEITSMICHPNKNVIAAYSNHVGQSRGQVVLWK